MIIETPTNRPTTYGFIKPQCEVIGFKHLWKDITPNVTYATNPPTHPRPQRECENCGKRQSLRTVQERIDEWEELDL